MREKGFRLRRWPNGCAIPCNAPYNGRRIVIFSGGPAERDDVVLDEIRAIHEGGGFGSIIGCNSFQREKADALRLLGAIIDIYAGKNS